MPTPTPLTDQIVTVCFNPGQDADWFAASEKVSDLLNANGILSRRFRVRRRALIGWLSRFFGFYLLDAARKFGGVTLAAGGRISHLDLPGMSLAAMTDATDRWRAWYLHVNASTRPARPWEDFLEQHFTNPTKVSLNEARRRFEQQPRVLAMLAYAGGHVFDPYELSLYQAGEAAYAGFHWRLALVGDALITTDGHVMRAASNSVADRMRFLNNACAYLRSLHKHARLCAVAIA